VNAVIFRCNQPVEGADSLRLRSVLELAKKAGMPKSSMENSINKGLGITKEGVELQVVTFEAMGPGNVSMIVDCLTDSKLRTMQEIKLTLKEAGATVTPAAYLFSRKGRIFYTLQPGLPEPQPTLPEVFEEIFERAMEIDGVEDVEFLEEGNNEGGELPGIRVTTAPELADPVSKKVMETMNTKLKVEKIGIEWIPNEDTMVDAGTGHEWDKLGELIDRLEESYDVQAVYTNARIGKGACVKST